MYGDGSLIRRGRVYYARFYVRGREVKESLRTKDPAVAERRFVALRRRREKGDYWDPSQRRVKVDELLDDLEQHLEDAERASLPTAKSHLKAVRREIGDRAVAELDTASVQRMQRAWRKAGTAPATINRRCELLREALTIATKQTPPKIVAAPHVPLLTVENARQGFLSPAEVARLLRSVPDADVRDFLEWFSWTGMRPGEIRQLTWSMVDQEASTLTVAPAIAKTRRGRVLALVGPLEMILRRRVAKRRLGCGLVFHRTAKGVPAQPVLDYSKMFRAALVAAKLPTTLRPYDLRRSALRNLIRSGTHETVAMTISGHRTRSTFDRYNITSAEDVAAAIERVAAWKPGQKGGAK